MTHDEETNQRDQTLLRIAGRIARLGGWTMEVAGRRITCSDEVCAIHESPPGTSWVADEALQIFHPHDQATISRHCDACVTEGTAFDLETEMRTAKGNARWVRIVGEAVRDARGEVVRIQGAIQDNTEVRLDRERTVRENRVRALVSGMNATIARVRDRQELFDAACRIAVETGGRYASWVGLVDGESDDVRVVASAGHFRGYLDVVRISTAPHEGQRGPFGRAVHEGEAVVCNDIERDPGFAPWRERALAQGYRSVAAFPLRLAGRVIGAFVQYATERDYFDPYEVTLMTQLAADISYAVEFIDQERRRRAAEAALRVSEERFRAVFEQAAVGICLIAADDRAVRVNDQFCQMLGYSPEAFVAERDYVAATHPDDRTASHAAMARLRAGEPSVTLEKRYLHRGGGVVWARVTLSQVRSAVDPAEGFVAIVADITELKRAEDVLREQATLLDHARDAIIVRDLQHRVRYWNAGAERLYGWTAAEALGRSVRDLFFDDPTVYDHALAAALDAGEWVGELEKRTRDGRKVLVEDRWTIVRDDRGRPKSILVLGTDITERRRMEAQFLRVQRMESIGTLAGGIAHDLNNVLSPILMSASLLQDEETDPARLDDLRTIASCAERGADMVRQLLSFARGGTERRERVDLGAIAREVQRIVRDTFPKHITFRLHAPTPGWEVQGDPTQMHQMLTNLCVNARDAMPDGGTLTVSVERVVLDEVYAGMAVDARPGPHVLMTVEDTGTGMPPDVVDRIFEPFFTTKQTGQGTGLGLSTVHAIVRSHGGFLNVYSEPGRGTRFRVYLPAEVPAAAAEEESAARSKLPRGSGELVLLVDDEESIRTVTGRTLERFGYRVVAAANGAEAVAAYVRHRGDVAVVLTDMNMPVLDGPATIVALRSIDPGIRIVGSSGLDADGHLAKAVDAGVKVFVPKPYTADMLLNALRKVLTEP